FHILRSALRLFLSSFFFFTTTATTEIYTLSLHDALPICLVPGAVRRAHRPAQSQPVPGPPDAGHGARHAQRLADGRAVHRSRPVDRKSTRLNSSHDQISYAVFCLKKKKK